MRFANCSNTLLTGTSHRALLVLHLEHALALDLPHRAQHRQRPLGVIAFRPPPPEIPERFVGTNPCHGSWNDSWPRSVRPEHPRDVENVLAWRGLLARAEEDAEGERRRLLHLLNSRRSSSPPCLAARAAVAATPQPQAQPSSRCSTREVPRPFARTEPGNPAPALAYLSRRVPRPRRGRQ